MPKTKQHLTVDGRNVPVSNLDKILFPGGNVTKAQVIQYYLRVSEYLLPHLRNRPVTLKRYPNGALGAFFYEKDAPRFTPEWVKTFPVPRRESQRPIRYILVNDRPTLAWVANLASLAYNEYAQLSSLTLLNGSSTQVASVQYSYDGDQRPNSLTANWLPGSGTSGQMINRLAENGQKNGIPKPPIVKASRNPCEAVIRKKKPASQANFILQ